MRGIATEPHLLLRDETASSPDPELVGEVLDPVRQLTASGPTIVTTTHEVAFTRDVADRIILLDGGVIEEGTATQLFVAPNLRERVSFSLVFAAEPRPTPPAISQTPPRPLSSFRTQCDRWGCCVRCRVK